MIVPVHYEYTSYYHTRSILKDFSSAENLASLCLPDLPVENHRYVIEPLSQTRHLKNVLIERFLSFLEQIEKSAKNVPKQLLSFIKKDVRSTTGSNLRNILHLTKQTEIEEIKRHDVKHLKYKEIDPKDNWRLSMIKEITDVKFNQLDVINFEMKELEEILEFI